MGKISSYSALAGTTAAGTDLLLIDHPGSGSPTTYNITVAALMQALWANAGSGSSPVLDSNGNNLFALSVTSAAVNYVQISNSATGNAPTYQPIGTDTNIGLQFTSKGTGAQVHTTKTLDVGANGATNPALAVVATAGSVATGVSITGAAAGSGVAVAALSSASNENLTLDAKGAGAVTIGGTSTGLVSVGRGSVSTAVFSGAKTSLATQNITPTAAQLLSGYISHASTTGAGTFTLPLASTLDTAIAGAATGDNFELVYSNTGTQTVTITTNTGFTLHGTVAITTGKVATLYFFKTGTATYDVVINASA